jgi:competence CoiA-like predicted nuclease
MDAPKLELMGHDLRCPDEDCHAPFIVRHGTILAPHFAHVAGEATANCIFMAGGGESEEHRAAKNQIIAKLRSSPLYRGATIEPERILRSGALKRIADVYVVMADGTIEVHEAQLSRITVQETQARSDDYRLLGASTVIWWFGRANNGDTNLQQWALRDGGGFGQIDFTTERVVAIA